MIDLIPALIAVIIGLLGLLWGADRFVAGSASLAKNMGISPLIIGLTIVSIGTSAPEIIVAINASLSEAGDMAVGNALGSNLANIGLVLGITALVAPLPTQRHLIKHEAPILLIVTLVAGLLLMDGHLSRIDGALLLLMLVPVLWITVHQKKNHLTPQEVAEEEENPEMPTGSAILWFAIGLAVLLLSSKALVWGAKEVATAFGVSQLIIGLTVVAVGTSLPELAASVVSALRGHHDIALGNIFGSNLFNLMAVMSMPGLIAPLELGSSLFSRDYLAMAALTLLLVAGIAFSLRNKSSEQTGRLGRRFGSVLVLLYALYYVLLFGAG